MKNVGEELCCIINTGCYTFSLGEEELGSGEGIFLEYEPSTTQSLSLSTSLGEEPQDEHCGAVGKVRREKWNSEQIGDFVRKLGFIVIDNEDLEKLGLDVTREQIKDFLYLNQVSLTICRLCMGLSC